MHPECAPETSVGLCRVITVVAVFKQKVGTYRFSKDQYKLLKIWKQYNHIVGNLKDDKKLPTKEIFFRAVIYIKSIVKTKLCSDV